MRKLVHNNYFYEINKKLQNVPTNLIEDFDRAKFEDFADFVLKRRGSELVDFANVVVGMNSIPMVRKQNLNQLLHEGVIEGTIHAVKAYQDSLMTTNYSNLQRRENRAFYGYPDSYELEKIGINMKCTILVMRSRNNGEPTAYISIELKNSEDEHETKYYAGRLKECLYENAKMTDTENVEFLNKLIRIY